MYIFKNFQYIKYTQWSIHLFLGILWSLFKAPFDTIFYESSFHCHWWRNDLKLEYGLTDWFYSEIPTVPEWIGN